MRKETKYKCKETPYHTITELELSLTKKNLGVKHVKALTDL